VTTDDLARYRQTDASGMSDHLARFPDDLAAAWALGAGLPLAESFPRIARIVIVGLAEAKLAGEMLAAYAADLCNVPICVWGGRDLPAFADGQSTLVILIDHSGSSADLCAARDLADARGAKMLVISMGGALAAAAERAGSTLWRYKTAASERAALGWQFGLLLAFFARLGWLRDLDSDMGEAIRVLREEQPIIGFSVPPTENPAKRLAAQMIGRLPLIYAGGVLIPAARRWKAQIALNGKAPALADSLPDLTLITLSGLAMIPSGIRIGAFCLAAPNEPPHLRAAAEAARQVFMMEGIVPDTVTAKGASSLAHLLYAVHFGDYVSLYLALLTDTDPTPTPARDEAMAILTRVETTNN